MIITVLSFLVLWPLLEAQSLDMARDVCAQMGGRIDSVTKLTLADQDMLGQAWYKELCQREYGGGYSPIYRETGTEGAWSVAYGKNYYLGSVKYTLIIFYNVETLLDEVAALAKNTFGGYALATLDGTIFYSVGMPAADVAAIQRLPAEDEDYFTWQIPANMWQLVARADSWALNVTFQGYFLATIFLFVLLCILSVLLISPAISRAIAPVNDLAGTMKTVAEGDLDAFSAIRTHDEIQDLSDIFNHMLARIKAFMAERVAHEKSEQRMRYSLLISQIDPHFIYNTMNIINALARKGRDEEIIAINTALIKILQDRLRVNEIEVFDSVRQEIRIVKEYLLIQDYRYENQARIQWRVDEAVWERQIPKNIIQPLVENALFHGLINPETGIIQGAVTIRVEQKENGILILVQDNGRGISPDRLEQIRSGTSKSGEERGRHIGLDNIRERLAYLYKTRDCMQIESGPGTVIRLFLPDNP